MAVVLKDGEVVQVRGKIEFVRGSINKLYANFKDRRGESRSIDTDDIVFIEE